MNPRAAKRWVAGEPTVDEPATPVALDAPAAPIAARLARAVAASLVHRIARGEGALLAIDLSILAVAALPTGATLALATVCVLALTAMYAVNDLCDAREDRLNPKKDLHCCYCLQLCYWDLKNLRFFVATFDQLVLHFGNDALRRCV